MRNKLILWVLVALFAIMMSIPWLVPHMGWLALCGFLPLLFADDVADHLKIRCFWLYYFIAFMLWNACTTFWVGGATVGGAIFAIVANAFQMALVWALFRLSKRRLSGVLPYVFLAVLWIAWEKACFNVQISWPWLSLGNAFARTTRLVQWYSVTGSLGGSLWVWLSNLSLFGFMIILSDGEWQRMNVPGRSLSIVATVLVIAGPLAVSLRMYDRFEEKSEGSVKVLIAQPNFDPYEKFESMSQEEQNSVLLNLFDSAIASDTDLLIAPETFTGDILLNDREASATVRTMRGYLSSHPGSEMLFGASTYEVFNQHAAPSLLARQMGDGRWLQSHNSAVLLDDKDGFGLFHKSKLVVGTELTPYPKLFVPLDDWLSRKMGVSGLMGRCVGQDKVSVLHLNGEIPMGCAVCYESVYGEYCTEYVKAGAELMTVITNDAWWGDTPGYKQHMSYSRLRAIELHRDIARCGNTGISAIINQRGDVVSSTDWWTRTTLSGEVNLNSGQTPFVRYGDVAGRVCTLAFLLLFALFLVKSIIRRN